jgi:membrane protease YdiL (CAAX protease family)
VAVTKGAAALGVVESVILLLVVVGLLATAGGWIQVRLGVAGLAVTELALVALPAVAAARAGRVGAAGLGLEAPSLRALAGGLLAGAGGFYLVSALVEAGVERVMPLPPAVRDGMRRVIVPAAGARPLAVDLAVLAIAPAVCEELLFRGALLRAWQRGGQAAAIGLTALAFGMFHLSLYKLVPTAVLALVLGTLAARARSVAPAMVAHATNNTLVVLLVRAGQDDPPGAGSRLGIGLTIASIAALAAGIRLAIPRAKSGMGRTGNG